MKQFLEIIQRKWFSGAILAVTASLSLTNIVIYLSTFYVGGVIFFYIPRPLIIWLVIVNIILLVALWSIYQSKIRQKIKTSRYSQMMEVILASISLLSIVVITIGEILPKITHDESIFVVYMSVRISMIVVCCITTSFLFWYKATDIYAFFMNDAIDETGSRWKNKVNFEIRFPTLKRIPFIGRFICWAYDGGYWINGALIVVVAVGAILRFHNIGNIYLNVDESILKIAFDGIREHGIPYMPTGYLYSREILGTYIMYIIPAIFGYSESILRITPIIFGLASVVAAYIIGRHFVNKHIGIISATIISLSVAEIAFSRWMRFYIIFQFFFLVTFPFIFKYFQTKRRGYLVLYVALMVLTFFTHRIGAVLVFLFIPILGSLINNVRSKGMRIFEWSVMIIGGLFILYSIGDVLSAVYEMNTRSFYEFNSIFSAIGNSLSLISYNIGTVSVILALAAVVFIIHIPTINWYSRIGIFIICCTPFLIDIFSYSQGGLNKSRYIFFLLAPFIILTIISIYYLLNIIIGKRFVSAVVLPLMSGFIFLPYITFKTIDYYMVDKVARFDNKEDVRYETSNANVPALKEFINKNPGMIIMASPSESYLSYFGKNPDYWIVDNINQYKLYSDARTGKHYFTGISAVQSVNELIKFRNRDYMIFVEKSPFKLWSKAMKEYTVNNHTLKEELSNGELMIYVHYTDK